MITNNTYTLKISFDGDTESKEFMTKLDPYYASVKQVRMSLIGGLISDYSDQKIAVKIFENSILAEDKAEMADNEVDQDADKKAHYVYKYVLAKTVYDLFLEIYLNKSTLSAQDIDLADFSISGGSLDGLQDLLELLKDDYEKWEEALTGNTNIGHASPVSVVKSDGNYSLEDRTLKEIYG